MRLLKQYWKSLFVVSVIFYLSILRMPAVHNLPRIPFADKVVHFLMYCVLSWLVCRDMSRHQPTFTISRYLLFALLLPISYGGLIEWLQGSYFPPRTTDIADFLANSVGSVAAFILFFSLQKRKQV